jgi:hypothetical protein
VEPFRFSWYTACGCWLFGNRLKIDRMLSLVLCLKIDHMLSLVLWLKTDHMLSLVLWLKTDRMLSLVLCLICFNLFKVTLWKYVGPKKWHDWFSKNGGESSNWVVFIVNTLPDAPILRVVTRRYTELLNENCNWHWKCKWRSSNRTELVLTVFPCDSCLQWSQGLEFFLCWTRQIAITLASFSLMLQIVRTPVNPNKCLR